MAKAQTFLAELIEVMPHADDAVLVPRGIAYSVWRAMGETDFVASCYSLQQPIAKRCGLVLSADDYRAFMHDGPRAIAAYASEQERAA